MKHQKIVRQFLKWSTSPSAAWTEIFCVERKNANEIGTEKSVNIIRN